MQEEIEYNKKSSKKYGWDPGWFGSTEFDENLIINIKIFQKSFGLTSDGMCGPGTYRRVWTERESNLLDIEPPPTKFKNTIVHNGVFHDIQWGKVVHWFDETGLMTADGAYKSLSGSEVRKPTLFVNHWDVCLNSQSCAKVLQQRGISVHFCIDNDGTIYQLLDTQQIAWHAGSRLINDMSIGVEISNAFYPKYQDTYVKRGHGERPLKTGVEVHGKILEDHLGFYQVQLDALAALWESISRIHQIELVVPELNGKEITDKYSPAAKGQFSGFVSHYHLTDRKIDCAGLAHVDIAKNAKNIGNKND